MVERRGTALPILIAAAAVSSALIWTALSVLAAEQTLVQNPIWTKEVLADLSRPQKGISRFVDTNRAGLTFLSNSQLIAYEVDLDTTELSSRVSPEASSPFRLRLSLLDSTSGKLSFAKEQGTRAHDSAVFATAGGVLVKTGELLRLYSLDLTERRDLPFTVDPNSRFRVSVSPSGKTIMLNQVIQDPSTKRLYSHFDVFDATTLKVTYSWNESPPLYHHYSISDKRIAAVNLAQNFIEVAEFGTSRWIRVAEPQGRCASMNMPTLYANAQFVYGCDRLIAMSVDGDVLMTDQLATRQVLSDKTALARAGEFVAVSINTIEAKSRLFTEPDVRVTATQIVVYDLTSKRRVLTVDVDPLPTNDYDFALSPDGSMLAVLNDRNVSVYTIPVRRTQ